MLVTFSCKAYADVTLFAGPARLFLQLLGFGQTIPGAIRAEDVPTALAQLKAGLASEEARFAQAEQAARAASQTAEKVKLSLAEQDDDNDDSDAAVPLSTRAQPLLKLFAAAQQANTYVMWQAVE
jgi:hypothetical protein